VALLSLVSDLVIVLDDELRISGANAAVERRLGYSATSLVGREFSTLVHPTMRGSWLSQVADARAEAGQVARAREVELKLVQCDGGNCPRSWVPSARERGRPDAGGHRARRSTGARSASSRTA
jgi:PAS domain S-box-containing protein